jgi:hypothetical protein
MKQIIDGQAYNTKTATLIASGMVKRSVGGQPYLTHLYRRRVDGFFLHINTGVPARGEGYGCIVPCSAEAAADWLRSLRLIGGPEASAENACVEVHTVVRTSSFLNQRIRALAKASGMSMNAWITSQLTKLVGEMGGVEGSV